ncbi:MAG: DUF4870 domain-containing protein [Candidatus Marsarchaeota archaeon]|nr:DUF4870 domain-containing protein [Candidatus Marsarchaeota archaeon]
MKKGDSNILAAASYVLLVLTGVLMLVFKEDDEFVKFHSIQSIVFAVVFFIVWIVLRIIEFFISLIPFTQVFVWFLSLVFGVVFLAVWLYLMYEALEGKKYTLPFLKDFMKKYAR